MKWLLALTLVAQSLTPVSIYLSGRQLAWGQYAPTSVDAQAFVYRLYLDGRFAAVIQNVVCENSPTAPYGCWADIPDVKPGNYRASITAAWPISDAVESERSEPFPIAVKPNLSVITTEVKIDSNTVGPNPWCDWHQAVESPNKIENYSWRYHLDGAGLGILFHDAVCNGGPVDYNCTARLNVTIPGQHTIYIITRNTEGSETADSTPSPTTTFYVEGSGLAPPNSLLIKKDKDK